MPTKVTEVSGARDSRLPKPQYPWPRFLRKGFVTKHDRVVIGDHSNSPRAVEISGPLAVENPHLILAVAGAGHR
jgi:hypothetical protein